MTDRVMQSPVAFDRIPPAIVFRALLPFALGYFMSYLFRAVNQVARIAKDPVFWRVAPMVAIMSGAFIATQTLWAGAGCLTSPPSTALRSPMCCWSWRLVS
jgi:hypothetical protein